MAACGSSSKTIPGPSDSDDEKTCEAGSRRCDGLNVKVCDDDGLAETIEETCLPSQSCSDGVCTETSCVPNTKLCKGQSIYKCDSTGGGSVLVKTCPSTGQYCVEDDGDAECSDVACTAGAAMCDGTVATTCATDGSGPRPDGTDCAATGQACVNGACRDQACQPGMKTCQHDDVYLCSNGGTEMSLLAECGVMEACDGEMGACRPRLCEPGKVSCDETRIVECNEYGTGYKQAGTDCASDDKLCIAGTCKKQTCTPSTSFCKGDELWYCDSDGVKSTLSQTCSPNQHCGRYQYASYDSCIYNECEPGEKTCYDNVVKTCTDESTWPATGTDCGNDNYCENATCKPRVCEPYTYYCDKGNIWYCDYFGGPQPGQQPQQVCASDTTCKQIETGVACVALPCEAGTTACLGNKVGTCAQDGNSLSKVTDDCTTAGNICTADAKCAKSAEDQVAVAEAAEVAAGGEFMGNVFEVTAARKLTKVEMNLVLAAPRELRWVIYEQSGATFIARTDKVVSNQSGTGFISSGAFTYNLKAGKRYLIGVAVSGGDSVSYYDGAPWAPSVSFGSTLGYMRSYYAAQLGADYLYSDRLYQMRVTTEAQ